MIDQGGTCRWNLVVSFVLSPRLELDRSCLNKINQIDFSGETNQSKQSAIQYFGTDQFWNTKIFNETTKNRVINFNSTFSIFISIFYHSFNIDFIVIIYFIRLYCS